MFFAAGAFLLALSVGSSAGYAWYLRSDSYRAWCARTLSASLALPSEIGRIVPRSSRSREFQDIRIWLPERRAVAAQIQQAVLINTPTTQDPLAYQIELRGGSGEISTRTWLRSDYRGVFEAGARTGFGESGPRVVNFSGLDLLIERPELRARLRGASGRVTFDRNDAGQAEVFCHELNGLRSAQPLMLQAQFSDSGAGARIDRLSIRVPTLPLAAISEATMGAEVRPGGQFDGTLEYSESDSGRTIQARGQCRDLNLADWTPRFVGRAWRGSAAEVELQELRLVDARLAELQFRGVLNEIALGDLLASAGLPGTSGECAARVVEAQILPDGAERLVFAGRCYNVSLEDLCVALSYPRISGNLKVNISDLTIEKNQIRSLDAQLLVERIGDSPNWIEGALLREIARNVLKINLPPILPERIEFTQLGLRLEVRDELLRVFGTHGPREKTILTVRMFEQDLPLVHEPEQPIDLRPMLDTLRARLAEHVASSQPSR